MIYPEMNYADREELRCYFTKAMRLTILEAIGSGDTAKLEAVNNLMKIMGYTYSVATHLDRVFKGNKWTVCEIEQI